MKVFGCVAYNMIKDPSRRDKLASKAAKCVFLGYSENVKALKLYDLAANKTVTGVHARFHETEFLGERAKIDDYVVTRDDDDDEEEIDTSDDSDGRDAGHAAWVSTQETNDTPDETKDCLPPDHETVTLAFDGLEIACAAFPSPDDVPQSHKEAMARDPSTGSMRMSQEAHATKIIERLGLSNSCPHMTPAVAEHEDLWFDDMQPKVDQSVYRSMVGTSCT
ncbi:hypothetical protein DYB31_014814 [Aphanomyces astaci]|uniref:Retroviral polymerase SH3-like domain-containing protein n=1 Tax=Aphanomyces astaci TaxID=112090 RepID=A0A397FZ76_APHAT|nr:hypothetical protein DYB31_014814 [Aphanomyces astaci]